MVADIRNDRFDTWRAELGAFMCQRGKTDTPADGSPDIADVPHPRLQDQNNRLSLGSLLVFLVTKFCL